MADEIVCCADALSIKIRDNLFAMRYAVSQTENTVNLKAFRQSSARDSRIEATVPRRNRRECVAARRIG